MERDWIRIVAMTWVEDRNGKREKFAATRLIDGDEAKDIQRIIGYLTRQLIDVMWARNQLFGHTVGPLRIETGPALMRHVLEDSYGQVQVTSDDEDLEPGPAAGGTAANPLRRRHRDRV